MQMTSLVLVLAADWYRIRNELLMVEGSGFSLQRAVL